MISALSKTVIASFAITCLLASVPASAGFFDKLMGKEEVPEGPPPEKTLQAPFPTTPDVKASQNKLMDMYGATDSKPASDVNNLAIPHRNEAQITEWTTEIVSQALTINPASYHQDFAKLSPMFAPYALKEYQDYLTKTNMMAVLTSNSYRLQAISDEAGAVTKDGAIGGTYHWLVQIPIMVSYYNVDMQSVEKSTTAQNQNLLVQVQVGRVAPKTNTDIGLIIERWNVSSYSKK